MNELSEALVKRQIALTELLRILEKNPEGMYYLKAIFEANLVLSQNHLDLIHENQSCAER